MKEWLPSRRPSRSCPQRSAVRATAGVHSEILKPSEDLLLPPRLETLKIRPELFLARFAHFSSLSYSRLRKANDSAKSAAPTAIVHAPYLTSALLHAIQGKTVVTALGSVTGMGMKVSPTMNRPRPVYLSAPFIAFPSAWSSIPVSRPTATVAPV